MYCRSRASGGRWGVPASPSSPPAVISCRLPRGLCVEGSGGVSQGGRTAPGDGAGGDAAARRGRRRGRSRRLRQSERSGGCGEPTGPGCAVFVRQSGALGGDRSHRCFCMICFIFTFLRIIFLRWHAPRLFAALAPSLMHPVRRKWFRTPPTPGVAGLAARYPHRFADSVPDAH